MSAFASSVRFVACDHCGRVFEAGSGYCNHCDEDLTRVGTVEHFPPGKRANRLNHFANGSITFGYLVLYGLLLVAGAKNGNLPDAGLQTALSPLAAPFFYLGARTKRRSLQVAMRPAEQALQLDPRRPVVYLRSFQRDRHRIYPTWKIIRQFLFAGGYDSNLLCTFEELLVHSLYPVGPVVGLGDPAETRDLPEVGAHRVIGRDTWKTLVLKLAQEAALIVVVLDEGAGIGWELDLAMEPRFRWKSLLVVPHLRNRSELRQYQAVYRRLRTRIAALPDFDSRLVALTARGRKLHLNPLLAREARPSAQMRLRVLDAELEHWLPGRLRRARSDMISDA